MTNDDEPDSTTSEVPSLVSWGFALLFFAILVVPPVLRNVEAALTDGGWVPVAELFNFDSQEARDHLARKRSKDETIIRTEPDFVDHRQAWEAKLEDAEFTEGPRQVLQVALTAVLREGNRKVVLGQNDWLFYRPAIDALSGYGPLRAEPDSVAKDPNRAPWRGPIEAIPEFAAQLAEFNTELLLVPIPVKPMILPDALDGGEIPESPIRHPDSARFYDQLRAAGVHILDPAEELLRFRQDTGDEIFLRQDTHWTPVAMEYVASLVGDKVRSIATVQPEMEFQTNRLPITNQGDLAGKLEMLNPPLQRVMLHEVFNASGERLTLANQDCPIVLLGDSFTNIYRTGSMGWGEDASFAHHLSRDLGHDLDVIALNGQASTGVRRTLANRRGSAQQMRRKSVVIWAIAARDLFLTRSGAQETDVEWERVEFNELAETPQATNPVEGQFTLEGELLEIGVKTDPDEVDYLDCLVAARYKVADPLDSGYEEAEIVVYHWLFQDRKLKAAAGYEPGMVKRLEIVPWEARQDLNGITRSDLPGFYPDTWWAEVQD